MKRNLILTLIILGFVSQTKAQVSELETKLLELPDVIFEKVETVGDFEESYELKIKQPLDHADPQKGFFYQKAYLNHKGFDSLTVMVTEGYAIKPNNAVELATLLQTNQIQVEHRYFGESLPDSLDYHYLNLKQATADLHHIRELFRAIYKQKWVSTGISKGGVTSIFYRYFYPKDIDVSVPYVAPINTTYEDKRLYHFLDTIGTEACRNKIKEFQIQLLKNRVEIIAFINSYLEQSEEFHYSYVSIGEAFEYAVMEYPVAFWQLGGSCDSIPTEKSSISEMTIELAQRMNFLLFSDELIEKYTSHYYQAATEMGYYGYETAEFKEYLVELPTDYNPMSLFFPFEMTDPFDGTLLKKINKWVKTKGDKTIYIYGTLDPWTAHAVQPSDKVDSEWFFMKGKNHGNANINNMTDTEKERLITTLEKWLDIKID